MSERELNIIDGVNVVKRKIHLEGGDVELFGMTVRAMRKALENANPDAMVTYIFEADDRVNFGIIAGVAVDQTSDFCMLFGPEAVPGVKQLCAEEKPEPSPPPPVDRLQTTTTNGKPLDQRPETDSPSGQHSNYVVLTEEERSKGFARPVRYAYKHLTCGKTTTMKEAIAQTYARDPKFYTATYCSYCGGHFPVGEAGEFVWIEVDGTEGPKVGT